MNKAEKTKEQLAGALIELLERKPLDLIRIKELCDRAHVCKSAFYNNFKTKDDVLKYVYRKAHYKVFQDNYKNSFYLYSDQHFKDMIDFFDENSELLKVLFKWQMIDIITKYNTEIVMSYVEKYDDKMIRNHAYYFTCYSGVTYFNMCGAWIMQEKKESKEEFFQLIKYFESLKQTNI